MQDYLKLQAELGLTDELPVTPDWSAAADFLFIIKQHCLEVKPATIVECSSGLTTLTLAKCCQINHCGHVYSLENGQEYQLKTQQHIKDFALDEYADVIYAPLETVNINGQPFQWYKTNGLPDKSIDLLVIDGPPGFIQKHSRLPALPLLFERLAKQSVIFLDDAARDDERQIILNWLELSPAISHEYIETDRGCSVLRVSKQT